MEIKPPNIVPWYYWGFNPRQPGKNKGKVLLLHEQNGIEGHTRTVILVKSPDFPYCMCHTKGVRHVQSYRVDSNIMGGQAS